MNANPDFAVFSPGFELRLVVEIKAVPKTDADWAAKYRRNLLQYGVTLSAPYYLLVTGDQFYLWASAQNHEFALPDYAAKTRKVLERYLPKSQSANQEAPVSKLGLEMAVHAWLDDLTHSNQDSVAGDWLKVSGLAESVKSGAIREKVAA